MQNKEYSFSLFSEHTANGIFTSLLECNPKKLRPIFICIGSDLVMGDSLGPLVGTLLKQRNIRSYVYGTLNFPITAKEVEYARTYLKQMHPNSISIAIDAAVGESDDVGLIRILNKGLKPGLGVDKNLGIVGDLSIIGVVAGKSVKNYDLFNLTRLNLVYKMAETIANGIEKYIHFITDEQNQITNGTFGA
ncbi:MAG: spore protease YyaC [Clostridiales bacterium]|nr:spore protease YyaC [Clostridiales bacterium]